MQKNDVFITCPEVTLPCGTVVPSFKVGKYLASKNKDGQIVVNGGKPWVRHSYDEARSAYEAAGYKLITETQWLALAWDISQQDCNWTKGKVGKGKVFRGLHKGTVSCAQVADFVSPRKSERRTLTLSNGEEIFDLAGNIWEWVFDDVQGDADGVVRNGVKAESPTLTAAPYPSEKKGMGYRGSGAYMRGEFVPIRGGSWSVAASSGVFALLLILARSGAYTSIGSRPAFVL